MTPPKNHSPYVEQKRKARINAILDSAMNIILEKGPAGLTMRQLAQSMSMTAGALYRYFPTKGQIIGGLGNRSLNQYAEMITKGVQTSQEQLSNEEPTVLALHNILVVHQEYITLSLQSYPNYRILNMIMVHPERFMTSEEDYKLFMGNSVRLLTFAGQQFDNAVEEGALDPGSGFERALILVSLMNGSLQLIKFGEEMPELFDNPSIRQKGIQNLLIGMGADKSALARAMKLIEKEST